MTVCGVTLLRSDRGVAVLNAPRRVAVLAVHTSPLAQPGTGDAGGMNVYVLQSALHLARRGIAVEIFTRATASADPPIVRVAPGVLVRNVVAGPFEGLDKYDLPTQLCAFAAGVLRAEAAHEPGYYDIVHSHYWLSGQVGWLARDRWAVPLVHTAHTLAAVKNAALADGDAPEPPLRTVGEQQVVDEADRLIVNTDDEARQLISLHHADPARIDVVHPGVDLDVFRPGSGGPPGPRWGSRSTTRGGVRRTDPAAEGTRHRAARRREAAGGARRGSRRAVGQRSGLAGRTGAAGRRTRHQRAGDVLAAAVPRGPGRLVPGRRSGCGAELFGVVRAGRRRGAGLRHTGGGGRGGRAAGGGARRDQRRVGGRARSRSVGGRARPAAAASAPQAQAMGRAAAAHAATFSWENTTDALLASYRRAIGDFTAERQRRFRDRASMRKPRRWAPRRGVDA